VTTNYDYGTTLYALSRNEKVEVHKTKIMAQLLVASVEKTLLIPHSDVIHQILVGEGNVNAWMV
jgi:hypothetical protein